MTTYRFGDLILVAFPFSSGTEAKLRPAMVILDTGDTDVIAARVTTQLYQTPYDLKITEWQVAGLLAPSVIRLHKLATLEKTAIRRQVGQLLPADCHRAATILRQVTVGT